MTSSSKCVFFAVETRVVRMKEKIHQLLKDVDNSYNMALIKLPRAVRQMAWLEHCSELTPSPPFVLLNPNQHVWCLKCLVSVS